MSEATTRSSPPLEPPSHRTTVVIPAYNEAENMPDLMQALADAIRQDHLDVAVVLVDDGSTDGTGEAAERAAAASGLENLLILRHRRNRGKTQAIVTGAQATRSPYVVLFDADLQHSPREIARFLERLDEGYDIVAGRKIGSYEKRFVSGVYNRLSRWIFRVPVHDMNSMKAFRRSVLADLRLRKDWHRYLIALAHARGYRITEIDIRLYPRRHGDAKYSDRGRIVIGILDLLSVWFQLVFGRKPMLFFGITGLLLLVSGALTGLVAVYLRFGLGRGYRPLLTLVVLLVVAGLLLFVLGFLAELIASLRSEIEELREDAGK